jgi:hypothetical protein
MTTTVVGKESGRRIVVENTAVFMPTGNSFYDLYVRDAPAGAKVETKFRLFGVHLPIGVRHEIEVNSNNPHDTIWDATRERLDVDYKQESTPSTIKEIT